MRQRLLLFLAVASLIAADTPKDDVKKEQAKFEGTWTFVSGENNGTVATAEELANYQLVVKGNEFIWKVGKEQLKATVKMLDPTTTPKIIDIEFAEGPLKGVMEGVYQLDGDTMKLCLTQPDARKRPGDFSGKAGSNQILVVLKREKR